MPSGIRAIVARLTRQQRLLALAIAIALLGVGWTVWGTADHPPSCARNQDGMSMNALNECLTEVGNWCVENYPDDMDCKNKVYGYDPRPLGDD